MTYNPPKPIPEIVGEITCPACGAKTPVKVNKMVYYTYIAIMKSIQTLERSAVTGLPGAGRPAENF